MSYQDPVIAKLISVLNAQGPASLLNRYYFGDPLVVNKSALPAVFISRDKTVTGNDTVAEDYSRMGIAINVVYDLTRDFGQAFNNIQSSLAVYELMEGRGANYDFLPNSILGVLRGNYQLDATLYINLDKEVELDYGVTVNKRGEGIFAVEGVARFEVYHYQLSPQAP